jgi:glycosyltransferase involved in cell wall biosynthesis
MAYMGIPIALDLGRRHRARVVYDARDIYLEARNLARMNAPARWLLGRAERRWAHQADRVVTVNDAYADVMAERFGVERPLVVMNCSYRFEPPVPRDRRFHEALGLSPETRVVLYHGGLFPHRGIEELMRAIIDVPDATLVLMGYGVLEPALREAAGDPGLGGRVRLLPPVRPDELQSWVACADVVAMPIQPSTLNHRLTTPNKLFEAMSAGVPVVASDLPGMATIVNATGCGVVCDPGDPAAIAAALRVVLGAPGTGPAGGRSDASTTAAGSLGGWGGRALAAARDTYNWERQVEVLLAEYTRLTGKPW